jgi:hypothetical protein
LIKGTVSHAPKARTQISFLIVVRRKLFGLVEKAAPWRSANRQAVVGRIFEHAALNMRALDQQAKLAMQDEARGPSAARRHPN